MDITINNNEIVTIIAKTIALINDRLSEQNQSTLLDINEFTSHFAKNELTSATSSVAEMIERYVTDYNISDSATTLSLSLPVSFSLSEDAVADELKTAIVDMLLSRYIADNVAVNYLIQLQNERLKTSLTSLVTCLSSHRSRPVRTAPTKVKNIDKIKWQ